MKKVIKSDLEWKKILTDEEFLITRKKGTEAPFSGKEFKIINGGSFFCKCCDANLFNSSAKYDSGCGWPSFDQSIKGSIIYKEDNSLNRTRTEIICSKCDGHLGHVFNDGPTETGMRYCVNSTSLNFKK